MVLRHAGEHAVFADLSLYGHAGCFLNNCHWAETRGSEREEVGLSKKVNYRIFVRRAAFLEIKAESVGVLRHSLMFSITIA